HGQEFRTRSLSLHDLAEASESATLARRLEPPPIESSSATISRGSFSLVALRFSRRCPTEDVPGISKMLGDRCRSHASATCIGVLCSDAAVASSFEDCNGVNPPSGKNGT